MHRLVTLVLLAVSLGVIAPASVAFIGGPDRVAPQTRVLTVEFMRIGRGDRPERDGFLWEPVTIGGRLTAIRLAPAAFDDWAGVPARKVGPSIDVSPDRLPHWYAQRPGSRIQIVPGDITMETGVRLLEAASCLKNPEPWADFGVFVEDAAIGYRYGDRIGYDLFRVH
jgi:hypothetical protein